MATPEIRVTAQQATNMMRFLTGPSIPEKLGKLEFAPNEIAGGYRDMVATFDLLNQFGEYTPPGQLIYFGAKSDWKVDPETKVKIPADPTKTWKIKLPTREFSGIYWMFLLMAHHKSPNIQPIMIVSEIVWPLAAQLGLVKQLEADLGLDQRVTRRLVLDDDEAWASPKKEEKAAEKADDKKKEPEPATAGAR